METKNAVLMMRARESLSGKWGLALGGGLVYLIIVVGLGSFEYFGSIISLVITGPLSLGLAKFMLAISRKQEATVSQIFDGFDQFGLALKTYLLMVLYVVLWSFLLIIPGIIAAIAYSQSFYLLAEGKTVSAQETLRKSKEMMVGYKWKYFCLGLRFVGWFILSILTLGIGFLWFFPYVQVSMAKFYEDISTNKSVVTQV